MRHGAKVKYKRCSQRDVPAKYNREEYAQRMEQIGNSATSRDVSDLHRKEEFVGDIAQKESTQTTLTHHFNQMLMSLLPFHRANRLIM